MLTTGDVAVPGVMPCGICIIYVVSHMAFWSLEFCLYKQIVLF